MKTQGKFMVMARLVRLVAPLTLPMLAAVLLGVAGFVCATFLPVLGGYALLEPLGLAAPAPATVLLGVAAAFALARGPLRYGEQACNHYIAFKLLALLRDQVFGALRRLCPAKLETRSKGELITLITADVELLEVFYAHTLSPAAIALIMSGLMTAFIGAYHPLLGLVAALAYLTLGLALPMLISRKSGKSGAKARQAAGELGGYTLDSLRGLGEILQYRRGPARLAGMQENTRQLLGIEQGMKKQTAWASGLTGTLVLGFDLALLLVATGLYGVGAVGFDGVLIPLIALMSSFGPVLALAALGSTLQNTLAAGSRVLALLDEAPQVNEVSGMPAQKFEGAACEALRFAYEGEPVLCDVGLTLPKNEILGLSGHSGSGKSTLLRLLMRFWDRESGRLSISGQDIKNINTADLRSMEALVTQDTHLFQGSIAENLRIAKPQATQSELERACKKAAVHDFIQSLPQGYDTPVGELGDTLSGGQRQRLGLARAFLQDAPFLLLDEPTSNLDSLNEAIILNSLQEVRGEKTVLLVSHRASTLGIAHRVVRLENGRVSG